MSHHVDTGREEEKKQDEAKQRGWEEGTDRGKACDMVLTSIGRYFPPLLEEAREETRELVQQAYEWADRQYGVEEANEWADDFQVPSHLVQEDIRALQEAGGDLSVMAQRSRDVRGEKRMTLNRVMKMISQDNPERRKLEELASDGITVLKPAEFVTSGMVGRPQLRKKLLQAGGAVEKMIVENFPKRAWLRYFQWNW